MLLGTEKSGYELLKSTRDVFKSKKIVSIFQPHRVSRLNFLKERFTKCFKFADQVVLCPVYKAGENIKLKFNYTKFAKEIIKNSNVDLIMINSEKDLLKFAKSLGNKLIVGINSDKSVKLNKGKTRPYNKIHVRVKNLKQVF